jgi:hypothetical protein
MSPFLNVIPVQANPTKLPEVPPVDPVARSIARPDAFAKPGSIGKPGAATNQKAGTRVRTLSWKRGKGRPRIHPKDKRNVTFF